MNVVDIVILIIVILILGAIIFFRYIMPAIKGIPSECASCPATKHAKKYLKKYRKQNKK